MFRILRDYQADLRATTDPHGNEFALFQGDLLERWMLKLFWGGVAAGTLGRSASPVRSLRSTVDLRWMAEVLFRGEPLPDGWGLYMGGRQNAPFSGEAEVAIEPLSDSNGDLVAGVIEFGAIAFRFFLGNPTSVDSDVQFHRHPQGVFVSTASIDRQKVLALSWNDGGNAPVIFTRLADGTTERRPSAL